MTFLQLAQKLRSHCGISGSGPVTVVNQTGEMSRVVDWIEWAWTEIQNLHYNWVFLWTQSSLTTTVGVDSYTLTGIKRIDEEKVVLQDNNSRLRYLDYTEFHLRFGHLDPASGTPTHFTILPNKQLKLYPTPDQDVVINYDGWLEPTILSANDDVPAMPEKFHPAIIYYAMANYAGYEFAPEIAELGKLRFPSYLSDMRSELLPRQVLVATPFA